MSRKQVQPDWPAVVPSAPTKKIPTAAEVTAMGERFRVYTQTLRDMLQDIQTIIANQWPPADADAIADDLNPGKEQGNWVKDILASAEADAAKTPTTKPKARKGR